MSKPVLYSIEFSPPVRACRLTAAAIDLELDVHPIDFFNKEHLTEEFLKINPQHTIPTLVDDGESIWDSHAICPYLVGKYGPDDSLYPKDLLTRARIDQRLHFDNGVLFQALRSVGVSIVLRGAYEYTQEQIDTIVSSYELVEKFLDQNDYIAGNQLTVADFCCGATVTSLDYHVPLDADKYPKSIAWIERLNELPYFEELNARVMTDKFAPFFDEKKAANRAAAE